MQLQRRDRQNLICRGKQSDQESLQCKETLSDLMSTNGQNRNKVCCCRCRCKVQETVIDPIEKKKLKRKSAKRRQKEKQKQQKEKALNTLKAIIKDIYSLKYTFNRVKMQVRECLEIQNNKDKVCEEINNAIREEVDNIRKQIALSVRKYEIVEPGKQHEAVKAIFGPIQQIARASNEVEQLINLFVNEFLDQDDIPLQKNFGRTTLKYLVKMDLYKSGTFSTICAYIFKEPPERYPNQRGLINYIMIILDHEQDGSLSSQTDSEQQEDEFESDECEEYESTIESQSQKETIEKQTFKEEPKQKKKYRRKKIKDEVETNEEAIIKRMQQLQLQKYEREQCHVTQQCINRLRKRKWKYMLKDQKK